MIFTEITKCPICGNNTFIYNEVLWSDLIISWELKPDEVDYINKQQGYCCSSCKSNLRSMTLADGLMHYYNYQDNFTLFCESSTYSNNLSLLEINEAGNLSKYLSMFKNHTFAEYPKIDIQCMSYSTSTFDVIIHSDTLEHVYDSLKALRECWRILKSGGILAYTIPIIYGRMSRRRDFLQKSYHGFPTMNSDDYMVIKEYGADFWVEIMEAGFKNLFFHTLSGLSSLAIIAIKD